MARDILTGRQCSVLGAVHWFGDVQRAMLFPLDRDGGTAEDRKRLREVGRLTKRGYLRRGRLSKSGRGVVVAGEWNSGNEVLREMIRESKR